LANPQSLNSYSYADDNPITKKDPDGEAASLAGFISSLKAFVASLQSFVNSLASGSVEEAAAARNLSRQAAQDIF
jgi:hypothetical protein